MLIRINELISVRVSDQISQKHFKTSFVSRESLLNNEAEHDYISSEILVNLRGDVMYNFIQTL